MSKTTKGPAAKKVQKIVEDKTFGMKNKKGKKAQQVVKTVQNTGMSKLMMQKQKEAEERKKAKEDEKKRQEEERRLLGTVIQKPQVCPPGVDPKSILCMYFKQGKCQNGDKCKFGHDLALDNARMKRDMYTDARDTAAQEAADTMADWDEKTLADAVAQKSVTNKKANPTAKICKHFIKAIEERKYGWFWECPNGDGCIYRHALPPGYVLEKPKSKEVVEERPLEDILEEERAKLPPGGTQVTAESFAAWRVRLLEKRAQEDEDARSLRKEAIRAGARMTGRELLQAQVESGAFVEEGGEGEGGVDLVALRRAKLEEEEAIDRENALLAQQLADEFKDVEVHDPNLAPDPEVTVDESLFGEEGDLPDDDEDEDEDDDGQLQEDESNHLNQEGEPVDEDDVDEKKNKDNV
jgi:hypothetical protein